LPILMSRRDEEGISYLSWRVNPQPYL